MLGAWVQALGGHAAAAERWADAAEQGSYEGMLPDGSSSIDGWRALLIWLGNAPDGPAVVATYDPARRAWRRIAPSPIGPRESFSTVWTGRELIVFGGSIGDGLATPAGAAYDPVSDHWRILPAAPIAVRVDHAAVWTGREMLVWGGRDGRRSVGDGAAYDPRTDRWRPRWRWEPSAVGSTRASKSKRRTGAW
jgi:hypothetical protein